MLFPTKGRACENSQRLENEQGKFGKSKKFSVACRNCWKWGIQRRPAGFRPWKALTVAPRELFVMLKVIGGRWGILSNNFKVQGLIRNHQMFSVTSFLLIFGVWAGGVFLDVAKDLSLTWLGFCADALPLVCCWEIYERHLPQASFNGFCTLLVINWFRDFIMMSQRWMGQ